MLAQYDNIVDIIICFLHSFQMCLRFIISNHCKYVQAGLKDMNRQIKTKVQLIIMMMKGANEDQTDLIICWCNLTGIHHITGE